MIRNRGIACQVKSGTGTLRKCQGCKMARYCSIDCQKKHWRSVEYCHKNLCLAVYARELLFTTGNLQQDQEICVQLKDGAEKSVLDAI